ncbi:hypothetical protein WA1_38645 [Scytonema hofmannii PCC 7110]|uniref:Inactive STAND domain-containing protein n=2 Tax=Scytonema hofmannii TaxID=34078 RepID=A0A139X0M9_9CYAN|nr:hypothetical protein WA1_38645 [Scytonema hofmannii PCC 7110]
MDAKALNTWKEKLAYLEQQESSASDPAMKKNIQQQIKECKEKILSGTQLDNALLPLNYNQQFDRYRDFFETYSQDHIGAFLIHGQSKSCQQWLVHRLICHVPGDTDPKKILVRLDKNESHIEDFWKILAAQLNIGRDTPPEKIVEAVYRHYADTVILLFDNLDKLYNKEIGKILDQFWIPLVEKVLENTNERERPYLLMFLVDNTGCSPEWNINFLQLENCNPNQRMIQPIKLPKIERFSLQTLKKWVRTNPKLFKIPVDNYLALETLAQEFYDSTCGVPEDVMKAICKKCECQWSDLMNRINL